MTTSDNHLRIQSVLIRYFQKLDPNIQLEDIEDEDGAVVLFGAINTDIGLIRFGSWLHSDPDRMVFYVYHPIQILYSARVAVMELVTRLNYGLTWGCFEMDMGDGELRFRVGLHMDGCKIERQLIHNAIHHGISTLLYYHSAVSSLLYDNMSPEQSLALLEDSPSELHKRASQPEEKNDS
ncbi:MAG: YbjN domain-containing protein [Myxococcota bacterium]|nr:YbjN domain-containing protein [Myxococcota bacterium]